MGIRIKLGDVLKIAPLAISLFRLITGRKKEPVKITFPVSSKPLGLPKTEVSFTIPVKPALPKLTMPVPPAFPTITINENTTMKFNKVGVMALVVGVFAALAQPEVLAMLPGWASALVGAVATAVAALSGKAVEKN